MTATARPTHYNPAPMFGLRAYWGWRGSGVIEWIRVPEIHHDRDTTEFIVYDGNEPPYFVSETQHYQTAAVD